MPTIIDQIAETLGVSKASVSRALNDKPGVGADLRQRILELAQELDYVPTITARGLSTSRTFAVGFFIAEKEGISAFNDPFYGEILYGAEKALGQTMYHLIVATLNDEDYTTPGKFRFIRERRIDGMILAGPDIPREFILAMTQTNLPVILIDNRLEHSDTHSINADDFSGGQLAAEHLLNCGHREMAIIGGPEHFASTRLRIQGFQSVLLEHNLPPASVYQHPRHTMIVNGAEAFRHIIRQVPGLTAIFASTDSLAIGAIKAANALQIQVPTDISIIGFDDTYLAQIVEPELTTIRIPKMLLGEESVTRLVALLNNPHLTPSQLSLQVQLVERHSVKCLGGDDT